MAGGDAVKFLLRRADGPDIMVRIPPPTSNAQRQAEFRAAHPGYFRKYRINRRALTLAEQNAKFMADEAATAVALTMGMAAMASFTPRD